MEWLNHALCKTESMGWNLHIRSFCVPGIKQDEITADQIAYVAVIELPFRLRVGKFLRTRVSKDPNLEIVCLNRIDLPKQSGYSVDKLPFVKDRRLVNTRLCVIEYSFPMSEEDIAQIRSSDPFPLTTDAGRLLREQPGPQFLCFSDPDRQLAAIWRFTDLYFKYCPPKYQGDRVRPVWLDDFFSEAVVFALCLHPRSAPLPAGFLKTLLKSENPRLEERDIGAAAWYDAPKDQMHRFLRAVRSEEQPAFADKLLLLSHTFQQQHNFEMAVITAVAALEAALFAFSQKRLAPKFADDKALTSDFLREQGAYVLVRAIPRLFFSPQNIPPQDVFDGVEEAIKARNKIMHGKVDKSGRPSHLKQGHLGAAIRACRQLAEAFERETRAS